MCCKHLYSTITRIELHACFTICDARLCRLQNNLYVGVIFLCHILVMLLGYTMELNSCDVIVSPLANLTGHQCLAAILLISMLMVGIYAAWLRHWSCKTNFIIICCILFGTVGVKLIVFLYTNYLQFIL